MILSTAAAAAGPLRARLRVPVVMNFLDYLTGFMETWPAWIAPRPFVAALKRYELSLPRRFHADGVLTVSDPLAELFAEAGYPDIQKAMPRSWWGLAAPRGTAPRIIERLYNEFHAVATDADIRKRVSDLGHVAIGETPSATAAFVRSEYARYKGIVEAGNIKLEN